MKTTGPEQAVSFGPYTLNVIVPVGLLPSESVAVSVTEVPTVISALDTRVLIFGFALGT